MLKNVYLCKYTISKYVKMEKLPLIELAELNKSIIFRDSFQDIFSIADLDGGMDIGDPDSPERFAPMRLNALLMVLTFEGTRNPSGLCFLHCQTEQFHNDYAYACTPT